MIEEALDLWIAPPPARGRATGLDLLGPDAACAAAHLVVWRRGALAIDRARGHATLLPEPEPLAEPPLFDLASLTKPICALLAVRAIEAGVLDWETPVRAILGEWGEHGATLRDLLAHRSGLPAWHKYYEEYPFEAPTDDRRAAIMRRAQSAPKRPPGAHHLYSDLGYIALAALLERAWGEPLEGLVRDQIALPLGLSSLRYVRHYEGERAGPGAVATEVCARRGVVRGIVHDENTYVMGGVSAHAGLFSTARDLALFGEHLRRIDAGQEAVGIVGRAALREAWRLGAGPGHHTEGGWDTPSGASSSAGRGFAREASVGHLGFTGTSIWIERRAGVVAVLLTNRVHPTRENPRIGPMRRAVHEAVLAPPP